MTITPDLPPSASSGHTKARPMNLMIGYIVGAVFYAVCFVIAFHLSSEWWFNLLPVLFGGAVGWCVGMLLSPLTHHEAVQFSAYGKAVSAFVSGFVIAKLDAIFAGAVSQQLVVTQTFIGRILLFGITFFLGLQFTFVARRYA